MEIKDFNAVRVSLASPEEIRSWSYGEVTKPETINYRRLRPERDGLFCEAIFGPTRDWQCYCGKYKKVRFKGVICDKCGVEVTRSSVRRERMGHIELASPVAHIWYTRRVPSYLGLLLDISRRNLDRVLYFAQYVTTRVDEKERNKAIERLEREQKNEVEKRRERFDTQLSELERVTEEHVAAANAERDEALQRLELQQEERLNEIMMAAGPQRERLNSHQDEQAAEDMVFEPLDLTLLKAGQTIDRSVIDALDEAIADELTRLEKRIEQQRHDTRSLYSAKIDQLTVEIENRKKEVQAEVQRIIGQVQDEHSEQMDELKGLRTMQFLNEAEYRELYEKYGHIFEADMGAGALYTIVGDLDLDQMARDMRAEIKKTRSKQRRRKATKRLKVVEAFRRSNNKPQWMILTVLPVIPPDLRPMVQLDGGRFATSDLNDLYRRVINRNNRLKRLLDLDAPDVIIRNEKRMLQEAVDSLIDNSRRGKAVSLRGKRKLKSLSDMLKGKQGRFRRNLLGKRVDYSGRSVIVVGPHLDLHECGLPKKMALELFKPFVIHRLVEENYAPNVKGAKRFIEQLRPEVWGILEDVIEGRPVLLNRAPTLHRLGIQAFLPRLIDGNAIELHPLVCAAFNADFDGDQMALHVPLSEQAVTEAMDLMLSRRNLLKPADGEPTVSPTKDMVLGCYYLTQMGDETLRGAGRRYSSAEEVILAHDLDHLDIQAPITVRLAYFFDEMALEDVGLSEETVAALHDARLHDVKAVVRAINDERLGPILSATQLDEIESALDAIHLEPERFPNERLVTTTAGRVLFNEVVPAQMGFQNDRYAKGGLKELVADCYNLLGQEPTAKFADELKSIGFVYATRSGVTLSVDDISVPDTKLDILQGVEREIEEVDRQYRRGLITEEEQYRTSVSLWTEAKEVLTAAVESHLDPYGNLAVMSNSGSVKGGIQPLAQLAGMRGLMADPNGRIIPLPIRSNFREGLNPLEYFISTHGARKGLADTALRTADAGYLTRRLVDVSQDVIVREEDCGTRDGVLVDQQDSQALGIKMAERIAGRFTAVPVVHPDTGEILVDADTLLTDRLVRRVLRANVPSLRVRSPLTCRLRAGICVHCYGRDMGRGGLVEIGEAVGIIAAQSIGEPGTQLTLRTFHTGGVAGVDDITQGLPRITELFEARNPKGEAILSDIGGRVEIDREGDMRLVRVVDARLMTDEAELPEGYSVVADEGDRVKRGQVLATTAEGEKIEAQHDGIVLLEENKILVRYEDKQVHEYDIPATARLRLSEGDEIPPGFQITEGAKNPHQVLKIQGIDAVQQYLVEQVQQVYRSQGVSINDKHIEIIVRSMLRRVRIKFAGETSFLLGDLVDRLELEDVNRRIIEMGGQPAIAEPVLLGISKAALSTDSFLSASSFQHTINVLAQAAIESKVDHLEGLKENVIIGKLIPAGTGYRSVDGEDLSEYIRQREEGEEYYEFSLDDLDDFDDFDDFDEFDDDDLDLDADDLDDFDEDDEKEPATYLDESDDDEDEDDGDDDDEEDDDLIGSLDDDLIVEDDDLEDEEIPLEELADEELEDDDDFDDFDPDEDEDPLEEEEEELF